MSEEAEILADDELSDEDPEKLDEIRETGREGSLKRTLNAIWN